MVLASSLYQTRIPSVTRTFSGIYQAELDRKWVLYATPARGRPAKTHSGDRKPTMRQSIVINETLKSNCLCSAY